VCPQEASHDPRDAGHSFEMFSIGEFATCKKYAPAGAEAYFGRRKARRNVTKIRRPPQLRAKIGAELISNI